MKTRKQHYVFQAYLSAWTNQNKQLYCLRDHKIFCTTTENVAQERDFYKVLQIDDDEIKFLNWFWQKKNVKVKQQLFDHLNAYQLCYMWEQELSTVIKIRQLAEHSGIKQPEVRQEIIKLEEKLHNLIEEAKINLEESFMGSIEVEAIQWIRALRDEDLSVLTKIDKAEFFLALSIQYCRTKALRARLTKSFENGLKNPDAVKIKEFNIANVRVENIFHMLIWDFQSAVADFLFNENAHVTLLVNDTETPFITCDQPVINLFADYQDISSETKNLIFYYPLSPRIAITVNDHNSEEKLTLNAADVEKYNDKIFRASYENVFANDKNVLMKFLH